MVKWCMNGEVMYMDNRDMYVQQCTRMSPEHGLSRVHICAHKHGGFEVHLCTRLEHIMWMLESCNQRVIVVGMETSDLNEN